MRPTSFCAKSILADFEFFLFPYSDLEAAREQSQSHKQESQNQATQAAAALALNMKLQSTTTKNQTKTIDLEIKRLDAAQARELLSIVTVRLIH